MSAYNAINGVPCAANRWLLTDLLRGRWGFRGAVVGDVDNVANLHGALKFTADAAESSSAALKAGQDLCSGWTFDKLGEAVARGLIREAELDENLKRNLEVRIRLGQFDPPAAIAYAQIPASSIDAPEHDALSLEAARQAVVLLKNNGVLPLDLSRLKTVAILGPTADSRAALLGNYSGEPARPVNLLQGLRRRFAAAGIKTIHYRAVPLVPGFKRQGNPLGESQCLFADPGGRMPGLRAEIFHNPDFDGSPAVVSDKVGLDLFWNLYQPIPPIPAERASIRWQGFVLPPATGPYQFALDMIGGVRLTINGTVVFDQLQALDAGRRKSVSVTVPLQAGQPVPLLIELRQACTEGLFSLWWTTPLDPEDSLPAALAAAADADYVILCLGLTPEVEGEEMPVDFEGFRSGDRTTIQLPAPQRELLAGAAKLGKPVTVILTTGSALTFDVGKADAILCAWYYGQRGGDAVAEILCGEVNPAGRLPVTFYGSDSDLPAIEDYSMAGLTYKHLRRRPLFAFEHGLSYSTFTYGTPRLERGTVAPGAAARLTIPIKNTGLRDGDEVVQVYARDPQAGPERPICQLVGFQRQFIRKGETVDTRVALDTRVLRRWNEPAGEFVYDEGPWVLKIGPSSDCAMVEAELFLRSAP
jgi:beta-glucosidase